MDTPPDTTRDQFAFLAENIPADVFDSIAEHGIPADALYSWGPPADFVTLPEAIGRALAGPGTVDERVTLVQEIAAADFELRYLAFVQERGELSAAEQERAAAAVKIFEKHCIAG